MDFIKTRCLSEIPPCVSWEFRGYEVFGGYLFMDVLVNYFQW